MRKSKLYTAINVGGLGLGLAVALLISMYVRREHSYDQFHVKKDRIARLTMEYFSSGQRTEAAVTGTKPGPQFARSFPEIKNFCRTVLSSSVVKNQQDIREESGVLFADSVFFQMFSFPILEGDARQPIGNLQSMAISETTAKRYFGADNPVGQTMTLGKKDYVVNAVFEDVPPASQMHFDFVVRFENMFPESIVRENWWSANWYTYLELQRPEDMNSLEGRINQFMEEPATRADAGISGDGYLKYHVEPLTRVHLYSHLAGLSPNGSITTINVFSLVALLILLMACVNYTNLATTQALGRRSEMGMRRAIGASRAQLFWQFMGESSVLTVLAGVLSLLAAMWMLPLLEKVTGQHFEMADLFEVSHLLMIGGLVIIVALIAGSYPAWIISKMSGKTSVKEVVQGGKGVEFLRRGLIVLQFGISIFLIAYTGIILQQMSFLQQKNLGYDRDHVLVLPVDGTMRQNLEALETAIAQLPEVKSVTGAYETPEFIEWGDGITAVDEKGTHSVSLNALPVDLAFVKTMGMEMLAGRDFQRDDFALMDTSNDGAQFKQPYIINESLARKLGWTPEDAVGRRISRSVEGPVVGVVKDFHFESLHEPVKPLVIFLSRDLVRNMLVRVDGAAVPSAIASLGALWKERVPHRPFSYHFLSESYDALYQAEQRNTEMFRAASVLAITLGCLGLFGMAAYTIHRRRKEVSIRKVMGAGTGRIILLLSARFIFLVIISTIVALPLAWYAGTEWLQQFAYRISISVPLLLAIAVAVLLISFITVASQAVRGAIANPVKNLRES